MSSNIKEELCNCIQLGKRAIPAAFFLFIALARASVAKAIHYIICGHFIEWRKTGSM